MRTLLILLLSFVAGPALAQNGAIPLNSTSAPATDLVDAEGNSLSASQAFDLAGKGSDLSLLNPTENQDIWKNRIVENDAIQNPVMPYTEVQFKSLVLSQSGKLRFLGKMPSGETLNFITSKNVHTQLIRRNLLVKLGYAVPEITYVPKIKLVFTSPIDRELFVKELSEKTLGDPKRWIEEEGDTALVIDDLVAQKTNAEIVDLSIGFIPSNMLKGRRVLNALHALYSVTDFGESANLFSWSTGYILNDYLHLPYQFDTEFYASIDDIQWMARRMARLSRQDWEAIIGKSYLPKPVEMLIVEKVIARRNNLLTLVKLDGEIYGLDYNPKITDLDSDSLVDGELLTEKFPGYAARFSFGDPESPMSIKEMLYYGGVKAISTTIDQLVNKFNSLPFLSNAKDLNYKITERYNRRFLEQVFHMIETGEYKPVPFGAFALPSVNGGLVASRDVIAGNYLGTDNLFQLVDTVGVSGFAGAYIGIEGLEDYPMGANGKAGLYYNRLYSHVKPIGSMKAALKYPLSNMLVPLAEMRVGRKLKPVIGTDESDLGDDEKKELMEKIIPIFNKKMLPGESFIITDTLGANLTMNVSASYLKIITAQIGVAGNQMVVSRLQIFKVSDDEYQIYRDLGNISSFQTQLGVKALIPVIRVKYGVDAGRIKMDFYKIKFDRSKFDAEEKAKYIALKDAFVRGTIGKVKDLQVPIKFRYKLKQQMGQGSFLVAQGTKLNSRFDVRVLDPSGEQLDLFRRYTAKSAGMNYAAPGSDSFEAIVKILSKKDFALGEPYDGGGNAGFTFFGKAESKTETFESAKGFLGEKYYKPIVKLSRIWNGWAINRKKAQKILDEIHDRYDYDFFPPDVLNETKKIFLYSFHVNFSFYHGAIEHLLSLSDAQIDAIAMKHQRDRVFLKNVKFNRMKKMVAKARASTELKDISQYMNKAFDLAESLFTIDGISELCGGKENFFVYSKIEGFRSKDENGDQAVFSNSYGEYGHFMVSGPFDYLKRLLGISDAELGINWQLRRIY